LQDLSPRASPLPRDAQRASGFVAQPGREERSSPCRGPADRVAPMPLGRRRPVRAVLPPQLVDRPLHGVLRSHPHGRRRIAWYLPTSVARGGTAYNPVIPWTKRSRPTCDSPSLRSAQVKVALCCCVTLAALARTAGGLFGRPRLGRSHRPPEPGSSRESTRRPASPLRRCESVQVATQKMGGCSR
jgi:hypothetical protein